MALSNEFTEKHILKWKQEENKMTKGDNILRILSRMEDIKIKMIRIKSDLKEVEKMKNAKYINIKSNVRYDHCTWESVNLHIEDEVVPNIVCVISEFLKIKYGDCLEELEELQQQLKNL